MVLHILRDDRRPGVTLGRVSIEWGGEAYTGAGWAPNDTPGALLAFGFSLEDEDRGLDHADDPAHLARVKVPGATAIPTGRYPLTWRYSPKNRRMMVGVEDVPGFHGILVHSGNGPADTAGCVLVGLGRTGDRLVKSRAAVTWLETRVRELATRFEPCWLDIRRL